jgi:hypothetical protein
VAATAAVVAATVVVDTVAGATVEVVSFTKDACSVEPAHRQCPLRAGLDFCLYDVQAVC